MTAPSTTARRLQLRVGAAIAGAAVFAMCQPAGAGAIDATSTVPLSNVATTVDGVSLSIDTPVLPLPQLIATQPGEAAQEASAVSYAPFRMLAVSAIPYGRADLLGDRSLPTLVAAPGSTAQFADRYASMEESAGATQVDPVYASLFGRDVDGLEFSSTVDAGPGLLRLTAVWVTEAGSRVWVVRMGEEVSATSGQNLAQLATLSIGGDTSLPTTVSDSSTMPTSFVDNVDTSKAVPVPGMPAPTFNLPPWWYGADCDLNYNTQHKVQAQWGSMEACGTNDNIASRNYGNWATGELEWQCVELSKRYLNQRYGIPSLGLTNGDQVADHYASYITAHPTAKTATLVELKPGQGQIPVAGDVMSYEPNHTDVVVSSSFDPTTRNGSYTTINENWTSGNAGLATFAIVNGNPQYSGAVGGYVLAWLHDTTSGQGATSTSTSTASPCTMTDSLGPAPSNPNGVNLQAVVQVSCSVTYSAIYFMAQVTCCGMQPQQGYWSASPTCYNARSCSATWWMYEPPGNCYTDWEYDMVQTASGTPPAEQDQASSQYCF